MRSGAIPLGNRENPGCEECPTITSGTVTAHHDRLNPPKIHSRAETCASKPGTRRCFDAQTAAYPRKVRLLRARREARYAVRVVSGVRDGTVWAHREDAYALSTSFCARDGHGMRRCQRFDTASARRFARSRLRRAVHARERAGTGAPVRSVRVGFRFARVRRASRSARLRQKVSHPRDARRLGRDLVRAQDGRREGNYARVVVGYDRSRRGSGSDTRRRRRDDAPARKACALTRSRSYARTSSHIEDATKSAQSGSAQSPGMGAMFVLKNVSSASASSTFAPRNAWPMLIQ